MFHPDISNKFEKNDNQEFSGYSDDATLVANPFGSSFDLLGGGFLGGIVDNPGGSGEN
jgi:hypothetical protein